MHAARAACLKLIPIADPLVGATCAASTAALGGRARQGEQLLARALTEPTGASAAERAWAWTTLAETRARLGEPDASEAAFKQALALAPDDVYTRAAYADLLLDQNRPRDVRALLGADAAQADATLLRLTIAAQRDAGADAAALSESLSQRFAEARARGDQTHLREQARFALAVQHDTAGALDLSQRNFAVQREPADARILLECAIAAGDAQAAQTGARLAARHRHRGAAIAAAGQASRIVRSWSEAVTRAYRCLFLLLVACSASAHKPSDSYLVLSAHSGDAQIHGQWDIALRDLDVAVDLDADRDGNITWREVRGRETELFAYALQRLSLSSADANCPAQYGELLIDEHSDGAYAVLRFTAQCPTVPARLGVDYRLLFDLDPGHRGLLRLDVDGTSRSAVLSPEQHWQQFDLAQASGWNTFTQFVGDGMHHIWIGYDHMLFLISLLLPAVLIRREQAWSPVASLRSALLGVLAVVTAFTMSHSITLTLAALDVISVPSRLVESGIALSVLLAALNNIWPIVTRRGWVLAFCFGLVHGFGFASVLNDLGLPRGALALALAGFNVGVEIGQLTVVLAVVPVIYLLRQAWFYRPGVLVGGSSAIALVAGVWFVGRALGLGLG